MRLHGTETAIIYGNRMLLRIGKYRLYRIQLRVHSRIALVDHQIFSVYRGGFKRITDNFFVCIGFKWIDEVAER